MARLVPSRRFTNGFVAGGKRHDAEDGDNEGPGAGDAPALEDDAEVVCVPCEEHLFALGFNTGCGVESGRRGVRSCYT